MQQIFLNKTVRSRLLLRLLLQKWQFCKGFDLRIKLLVNPPVKCCIKYYKWHDEQLTLKEDVVRVVNMLRRDGYNVIVVASCNKLN